jgi:hypothetical protein
VTERDRADAPEDKSRAEGGGAAQRYHRAYRFFNDRTAGRNYFRLQGLIKSAPIDLSVYRFQLNGVYHVAVLGPQRPPDALEKRLRAAAADGEPVVLPEEVLGILFARQDAVHKTGLAWMEGHYRRPDGR